MLDKVAKFKLLAVSATIDGDMGKDEHTLLSAYASRLKIEAARSKGILAELKQGKNPDIQVPESKDERLELLQEIIKIISADDMITNRELLYFQKVARFFKIDYDEATKYLRDAMHD
jgi:uncharacterized tellurite resistance protein B-like protein